MKNNYIKYLDYNIFYSENELSSIYGGKIPPMFYSSLCVKDENVFKKYNSENLRNIECYGENKCISECLIHDILSNEGMLRYIYSIIDSDLGIFRIDYIVDIKTFYSIKFTRSLLGNVLIQMFDSLPEKEKLKAASIVSITSTYTCKQKYRDKIHRIIVKDKIYDFKAIDIINILFDGNKFDEFLKQDGEYNKGLFAFAIKDFIERERIFSKYVIDQEIFDRYSNLASYKYVDFESYVMSIDKNMNNNFSKDLVSNIKISDDGIILLDEYREKTYGKLENAIYYYKMLFELWKNNKNFFYNCINIDGFDIQNISNFISIYASILNDLDIEFYIERSNNVEYPNNLEKMTFELGEFIIVLEGNLGNSILPNRLYSVNKNGATQNKFNDIVNKISSDIEKKKQDKFDFKKYIDDYNALGSKITISIKERLYLFLKNISKTNLKGDELVQYEKKIFNSLFKSYNNVEIHFVGGLDDNHNLVPTTLISIKGGTYQYILVKPNQHFMECIEKEELENLFNNKQIYYISRDDIPGINKDKVELYVK